MSRSDNVRQYSAHRAVETIRGRLASLCAQGAHSPEALLRELAGIRAQIESVRCQGGLVVVEAGGTLLTAYRYQTKKFGYVGQGRNAPRLSAREKLFLQAGNEVSWHAAAA